MVLRIVADTNIIVSGLLWSGPPRALLDLARHETLELCTSLILLTELEDVLSRPTFRERLRRANVSTRELVVGYAALATLVTPATIPPTVIDDPDDDAVLACAAAAQAAVIVSGDQHLLSLRQFQAIPIVTATALIHRFTP